MDHKTYIYAMIHLSATKLIYEYVCMCFWPSYFSRSWSWNELKKILSWNGHNLQGRLFIFIVINTVASVKVVYILKHCLYMVSIKHHATNF
jgi:hypothetical protein